MLAAAASQEEIEELVRRVVSGADLSQMTGKVVRQKVQELLGSRIGDDERAFKRSVRDALKIVLASSEVTSGQQNDEAHSNQRNVRSGSVGDAGDEINQDDGQSRKTGSASDHVLHISAHKTKGTTNTKMSIDAEGEDEQGSAGVHSRHDSEPENDSNIVGETEKLWEQEHADASGRSATADAYDDDADDEQEDLVSSENKRRRPLLNSQKRRKPPVVDESDEDAGEHDQENQVDRKVKSQRDGTRPSKRSRTLGFTSEKDLERLKAICRQLGLRAAPRGKSISEKCTSLLEFLEKKGVSNPKALNRNDIASHRARIERETELAGIDESNIIEQGSRSRRSRNTRDQRPKPELPSDLSGEELSESSDHEDDEDEYKASSDDSD